MGRVCKHEGCEKRLRKDSGSGYCAAHWNHSAAHKAHQAAYRAANKEKIRESGFAYRETNAVSERARSRDYYARHPERRKAAIAAWNEANPEAHVLAEQRRRARKAANGGELSLAEWRQVLEAHGHRCAACGCDGKMTLDHVVPLAKGGRHEVANVQPLCRSCNSGKGARDWAVFLAGRTTGSGGSSLG